MKKNLIVLFLLINSLSSHAVNLIDNEHVNAQKDCFSWIFTSYDSWRSAMEKKYKKNVKSDQQLAKRMSWFDSNFGEEKFNKYKANLSCQTFNYDVDGILVKGYVIKPKHADKKLPVLVYNRGGNGNFGGVVFGAMMHNLFPIANEGFVIIGSQYRGTFTKDDSLDEFGGKDIDDVLALLTFVPDITGADNKRIGMYGASRGGMQTHLALKQTKQVKAIATIAGATDLLKELEFLPAMEKVYKHRIPNYKVNKVDELSKRSVLNWVNGLSPEVPILLIHGGNDKRVSVNNSIEFAKALDSTKIPHKLVIYPDDNHGLQKNQSAANQEIINWFNKFL